MVSLEDILNFMKLDKVQRNQDKEIEKEERAKERKHDMDMIEEMVIKVVQAEVVAAMEPLSRRQQKVEETQDDLNKKFKEILEVVTDLQARYDRHFPPLNERAKNKEDQAKNNSLPDAFNKTENDEVSFKMKKSVSNARRTIGFQCIFQKDVDRQRRINGARDENEARLFAVEEFLQWQCEMKVNEDIYKEMKVDEIFPPAKENWDPVCEVCF